MNKIIYSIASAWFWFELFAVSALLFPLAFLVWFFTVLFDRRLVILHMFSSLWSKIVFWLNPMWKVRRYGREKAFKGGPFVIVSNHQSGADILVLFSIGIHYKWVSKRSLFYFPFIGWNMFLSRYIALERGKKSSIHKMIEQCKKVIRQGSSIMIFPEGTRSKDGNIQPFKTGAFRIAMETKVPVLPIVIKGTSRAIRKRGLLIQKNHDISVTVLDPVMPEEFESLELKDLTHKIHDLIEAGIRS